MNRTKVIQICALLVALLLAVSLSAAGSDGGARFYDWPVFAVCAVLAFMINWLAFIPANKAQTERYYDLTGSLTYLVVIVVAVLFSGPLDVRGLIIASMVVVWAVRLGSFLFSRIQRDGKDDRFDEIKNSPLRFFLTWTLQALWVLFTAAAALAVITGGQRQAIGLVGMLGIVCWIAGFGIEVVADTQKSAFKKDPVNQGRFISTGVWAWSRHPNYFGEILLWSGIAIIAVPVLQGWQYVTLISPIFVFTLIRYISGVNTLEAKADKKWGDNADYQRYKRSTPLLLLKPPAKLS